MIFRFYLSRSLINPGFLIVSLMKYLSLFVVLSLLLTGCGSRDAKIQQQVAGTWVVEVDRNIRSLNIIRPDGRFAAKVTGFTNGSVIMIEGTIQARGGGLIETVTKSSQKSEKVPFVVHGQIIRLNERELVTKWDTKPQSVVVVARRVQK